MKVRIEEVKNFLLYLFAAIFFGLSYVANFYLVKVQHYTDQAQQFLHGHLGFTNYINLFDFAPYQGQWYWPLGPMPTLLLLPGVFIFHFFPLSFDQSYLGYALTIGIFFFCYALAKRFLFSHRDSVILALAFCFASPFQFSAIIPSSWYLAHIVSVFLMFLALWEFFHRQRWWLIGSIFGAIFLTRFTAGIAVVFFLFYILGQPDQVWAARWRRLWHLSLPVMVSGVMLLAFNYARFDNALDNGYIRAITVKMSPQETQAFEAQGLFSLRNIPRNFYYYFFKPPDLALRPGPGELPVRAGNPGMSFFVVAPIFLYIFSTLGQWRQNSMIRYSFMTMGTVLFFLLFYYHSGWVQLGPRYVLDFLPFTYIVLLHAFPSRRLYPGAILIVLLSAGWNLYFVYTLLPYLLVG